jgi:two-component system cell cycle response regulator
MSTKSASHRRSTSIPAPPAALAKVIRVASDPNGSLQELGLVCSKDAGLTIELLRLANSPRMGFADQVRNVPQAVVALGYRTVRAHAVTYAIRSAMASITVAGFDIELFWEDSLRRAAVAQIIAELIDYEDPFEAFALGLCQDLGSVLLALRLPHLSPAIQALRQKPGQARVEAERVLSGRTHAEEFAQSQMAKMLPDDLTKAVQHHHDPVSSGSARIQALTQLATAADLVADVVQAWPKEVCVAAAEQCLESLGVKETVAEVLDHVSERMLELSHDLQMDIGPQPTLEEVVADAQLAVLQMSQEHEQEAIRLEDLLKKQEEATRKLEEHNKKLLDMASKDPLTGMDNRRVFNRSMDTEIDRMKRYGDAFSLLVVDVDHFKRVNDTYGHPAGDKVLKELAARMKAALRDVDQIARLGGEEFGAILPSTSGTGARVAAERLRASVEGQPFAVDGLDLPITVSVGGVTIAKGSGITDADDIFTAADKAMYEAKNKGRNQVRWAKV